jgi:glutamate/aspartate transport system substrate-binding protein
LNPRENTMRIILIAISLIALLTTPLFAHELTETLPQIQKSGKIRIGYRKSLPPMSSLNKDGIPEGYSIDLCQEVVTRIEDKIGKNIKIEYVPVTAAERFQALSDNKIDILCGATTKTLSRGELVDFTQLTFVTGATFMTLKGTNLMNNFNGKKIGVVKETTTYMALKELFDDPEINAEIVLVETKADGIDALENGKIDAISADQVVLIGLALKSGTPGKFSILPSLISYEPFALAVRRNDADFRLEADRVISDLYRSKKILQIYNKWFGQFSSEMPTAFQAVIKINATPE